MKKHLKQIQRLTIFNIKSRYRNTYAGIFWVFLQPLIQFGIQAYAFNYIIKVQHSDYFTFLASGLLPWIFFTSSIEMTVGIMINYSHVFKSILISPLSIIMAQILDNFIILLAGLLIATSVLCFVEPVHPIRIFLLIPASIPILIATFSLGTIAATYQVFFRDLRFLVSFALQCAFFLTPILYPLDYVPVTHRWLMYINPIYYFIKTFRSVLFESPMQISQDLTLSLFISLVFLALSLKIWQRKSSEVMVNV